MNEIMNDFNASPAGAGVQSAATTVYTAAISFDGVKTMVLAAAGTLVAVILIIRIVSAYAKKNWGRSSPRLRASSSSCGSCPAPTAPSGR